MISLYRLKGRALQIDNTLIMTLAFFTGGFFLLLINFLPSLYERFLAPVFEGGAFSYAVDFSFSVLFLLILFGVYSSVRLGTKRYLFRKAVKKKPQARDLFFYFTPKNYFLSFFYSFKIAIIKLCLFLFCLFPSAVCFFMVERFSRQGVSALVCISLTVTAFCLLVNGAVFYSLFNSSLFLCDYYFIDGAYVSFRHLVSCSQRDMRGKNTLLTRMKMSFVGWFAFCLVLLPVPYVWGYYNQSLAVAAAEFMKEKRN